jgi:hypothetical protein
MSLRRRESTKALDFSKKVSVLRSYDASSAEENNAARQLHNAAKVLPWSTVDNFQCFWYPLEVFIKDHVKPLFNCYAGEKEAKHSNLRCSD